MSAYGLDGEFTFAVGDEQVAASPGSYVLVPRGTGTRSPPVPGAAGCSPSWSPGGREEMFFELADLPPDSITDTAVSAVISARYDSIPAWAPRSAAG